MNIITARKIGNDVGGHWTHDQRRQAFWKLDLNAMKTQDDLIKKQDRVLARNIWNFFGNLGVEDKQ